MSPRNATRDYGSVERDRQVYAFVVVFLRDNGKGPSVHDIANAGVCSGTSTALRSVKRLVARGMLTLPTKSSVRTLPKHEPCPSCGCEVQHG